MKVLGTLLAFVLVSTPFFGHARPPSSGSSFTESVTRHEAPTKTQQSKPSDFTAPGKVTLGVPLLQHVTGELQIEYPESSANSEFKQEQSRSVYRVELGYMAVRNVQLRLGLGYGSSEDAAVEGEEGEYTETSIQYGIGARYYFDLDNGFYPFLGTHYSFNSREVDEDAYDKIKYEGSAFDLGAGVLYALGGDSGGFLSMVLNRQTTEIEETSSEADSKPIDKSTAMVLELAAGLYF